MVFADLLNLFSNFSHLSFNIFYLCFILLSGRCPWLYSVCLSVYMHMQIHTHIQISYYTILTLTILISKSSFLFFNTFASLIQPWSKKRLWIFSYLWCYSDFQIFFCSLLVLVILLWLQNHMKTSLMSLINKAVKNHWVCFPTPPLIRNIFFSSVV